MARLIILFTCFTILIAYLQVYAPQEVIEQFNILNDNRIPYSTANFGEIPYGKQMMGEVVIANPMTNCEYEEDVSDFNKGVKQNRFVLSLRGDCTFVQKVRNS
jgi:hypothetical protein